MFLGRSYGLCAALFFGLILPAVVLPAGTPAENVNGEKRADVAASTAGKETTREDSTVAVPEAILYYFHRTLRCQTCLALEASIAEALHRYFGNELADGRLLWRPLNVEDPENIHFEEDFSLEYNSAILVRAGSDETASWKNLENVWDLLEQKEPFENYVRREVGAALGRHDEKSVDSERRKTGPVPTGG